MEKKQMRRVSGKEAMNLLLNFEVTREMFEASIPQLDALLREDGFPEECLSSVKVKGTSKKETQK